MRSFDEICADWQQREQAPSLTVAVLRYGRVLHAAGYGLGTLDSVYQTASLGKHFTAALALLLAGSGGFPGLDASMAGYLPEFPALPADVTLRHLLSHTAGIPDRGYDALDLACDYTDSELVAAIASSPLDFEPGTAWKYSNAGYVLAGIGLGRAAGAFYGDLLRERIFHPLGMATARVTAPGNPVGYVHENHALAPAAYVSPTLNRLADGGICLSIRDLILWDAALWGNWGTRVAEMFTETRLKGGESSHYGLGWFLSVGDRGRVAEHDGEWQGFSTAMVRYLDEGVSAVVLANLAGADAAGLAHALAAFGKASRS